MFRRFIALASTALIAGSATGCDTTDTWVQAAPASGWSAPYGDPANSSYAPTAGAAALTPQWNRSVKGGLGAAVALASGGYLAANAQTPAGCSLMVWETANRARQRWCSRLYQGGGFAGPMFDRFDNLYVGQPGAILSFPVTQWIRWRQPVIGMPTTPRIVGGGQLLVVTHLGQVLVFDAHRGSVAGAALDLVAGLDPTDSERGLDDCAPARARCPVPAAPAFSPATTMIVLGLWAPGAGAPTLVGLQYHPGGTPLVSREWTSDAVGGGPLGSPAFAKDGSTVYVNGRDSRLWALHAADGTPKWSVPLGYQPQTPPSVSPEGLILAGGGPNSKLIAVKDSGDHADIVWHRDDVTPLTTSSQAGADTAYAVIRTGPGPDNAGQALLVFDPADGHTLNSYPLAGATGAPVGVSVGSDRRVVTATTDGQVYGFGPA